MKVFLLGLSFLLYQFVIVAQNDQKMQTIQFAGVQFKVSGYWETDPFGSYLPEEWHDSGSAVCECSGIIFIDPDTEVMMVFYPSLKDSLDSSEHQQIWDYQYIRADESELFVNGKIVFEKEVSSFSNNDKYLVWKYKSRIRDYGYLMYFFAPRNILEDNQSVINTIINSFKKSKRLKLKIK